jgi:hypothetical protein
VLNRAMKIVSDLQKYENYYFCIENWLCLEERALEVGF